MLLRIRSNVGLWRVQVSDDTATTTVDDVLKEIEKTRSPYVVVYEKPLSSDPACNTPLDTSKSLAGLGIVHGTTLHCRVLVKDDDGAAAAKPAAASQQSTQQSKHSNTNKQPILVGNSKTASKNSNKNSVIDLVDASDDSDEDDCEKKKPPSNRKRPIMEDSDDEDDEVVVVSSSRKKQATMVHYHNNNNSTCSSMKAAPIKLFATVQDEQTRKENQYDKSHWSWTQCQTLREMLGFDDTNNINSNNNNNNNKIQWLVVSNFLIDFDFLLDEIPELLSIPVVTVFYGSADPGARWQQHAAAGRHQVVDFVQIDPSHPPGPTNPLPRQARYGVHHTKLFLVGYTDHRMRVIVHTSNLRHCDIHLKAQSAYIQDFPLATTSSQRSSASDTNHFGETLVQYMSSYGYRKPQPWLGTPELLTACLRRYDYSSAQGVLIPSVPGEHKMTGMTRYGHWKLRQVVSQHTPAPPSSSNGVRPIVCQFSSIGAQLSDQWLRQLQISMDTGLAKYYEKPVPKTEPLRLQFVYPTVDEIRNSIEGYRGGASVPGKRKNTQRPSLQPLWRKWTSSSNAANHDNNNPLCKPHNVPHIKTYYQVSTSPSTTNVNNNNDDNNNDNSLEYLIVTSHNMSKAAWGETQSKAVGRRFVVMNWELGVLVSPSTLGVDRLVYYNNNSSAASSQTTTATVPMPYPLYQPEPYSASDQPWSVDVAQNSQPDQFGRFSAMDL